MITQLVILCIGLVILLGFLCAESLDKTIHNTFTRYLITSPAIIAVLVGYSIFSMGYLPCREDLVIGLAAIGVYLHIWLSLRSTTGLFRK